MNLNENEENTNNTKSFHNKRHAKEITILHDLLKLKRKRNTKDSLDINNLALSMEKQIFNNIITNEEIEFFNISDSGNSLSMNEIETDYSNGSNRSNCEAKILELKKALQDKPYFQFKIM